MSNEKKEKFKKAILKFNRMVRKDPQNPLLWIVKGLAIGALDYFESALRCFDEALKVDRRIIF